MKIGWKRFLILAAIPLFYMAWVVATSDVLVAFAVGGDDGIEQSKALLLHRDPSAVPRMWNDQPWLHTMLTAVLFGIFGEHVWVPRLLSLCAALAMIICLNVYYRERLSLTAAAALNLLLLTSDELSYMIFAGMTEVPAVALGTMAVLVCSTGLRKGSIFLVSGSALLMAAGVHMKLTALVMAPCMLACWLVPPKQMRPKLLITFLLVSLAANILLVWMSPSFNLRRIWLTHSDARTILSIIGSAYVFQPIYLFYSLPVLFGGLVGIAFLTRQRDWATLWFPGVALISAAFFALFQRPWWRFYLIHFSVPLALLTAFAIDDLLRIRRASQNSFRQNVIRVGTCNAILFMIVCLWCAFSLPAYLNTMGSRVYGRHRFEEQDLVRVARLYHDTARVRQSYALNPELAFAAGLSVVPELTVISIKRNLVTGLDSQRVAEIVRKADLSVLILRKDNELRKDCWLSWLTNRYEYAAQGIETELWVERRERIAEDMGYRPENDVRLKYARF
jgi:Dolichyl-phosphate-mannose-protein mannosyltransferase